MGCSRCSRRSSKRGGSKGLTAPEIVNDFSRIGPTQTRVRSGNGSSYSIMSPLVKMRPPTGWSLWITVKGHKHFIEGDTAQDVVNKVTERYATNDIILEPKTVWFNANLLWVSQFRNQSHCYSTLKDLNAITETLVDPLIWDEKYWQPAFDAVNSPDYSPDDTMKVIRVLYSLAADKVTGCEVCHDELIANPIEDYTDQAKVKAWLDERFKNIVTENTHEEEEN